MAGSKKVFIDSSVLYSFVDRADANHAQAVRAIEQLSRQQTQLYTSIQAVQETYTAINRELGSVLGIEFLQATIESSIEVLYPQKAELVSAYRLIKLNLSRQVSFKEAITAVLMQKRGIFQILTFTYWQNLLGSSVYSNRI